MRGGKNILFALQLYCWVGCQRGNRTLGYSLPGAAAPTAAIQLPRSRPHPRMQFLHPVQGVLWSCPEGNHKVEGSHALPKTRSDNFQSLEGILRVHEVACGFPNPLNTL